MTETPFAMISEWMVNGTINDFVRAHPDVDRFGLVSFHSKSRCPLFVDHHVILQLSGVARGLIYIHSQGIIHGDLKGVRLWCLEPCFYPTNFDACKGQYPD